MGSFTKQPYEAFTIKADFAKNMASTETISSADVSASDVEDNDATAVVLGSVTINDTNVQVLVQDGSEAKSPYRITFRIVTSLSHKWELDVGMRVVEDRDV